MSVRAFYKLFNGVLDPAHNQRLFYSGIISCFSLPMLGVFDNGEILKRYHNLFAFLFFSSSIYYLTSIGILLKRHEKVFSYMNQKLITGVYYYSLLCLIPVFAFATCIINFGSHYWLSAVFEWCCVFSYMTLTMLVVCQNPYIDSFKSTIITSPRISNSPGSNSNRRRFYRT